MAENSFPPAKSCDSHVHVIGPKARFPLAPGHRYTPKDALAADLAAMLTRLGLARVVLVQPSFYSIDNRCMLDAMAGIEGARGVAVLADDTPAAELDALHARGVRGLRINIATMGGAPVDEITSKMAAAAKLAARHGWHVQVFVAAGTIEALAPLVASLPVDVVFDHFGLIAPGTRGGPLTALCRLLESGKAWVKISGAYRISNDPGDPRTDPLARALVNANPERIVWGSDWPHTPRHDIHTGGATELPFQDIDTRGLLYLLPRWLGDEALVKRALVDNPAKLYDFS